MSQDAVNTHRCNQGYSGGKAAAISAQSNVQMSARPAKAAGVRRQDKCELGVVSAAAACQRSRYQSLRLQQACLGQGTMKEGFWKE